MFFLHQVAPGVELKARELKDGLNITTLLEGESLVVREGGVCAWWWCCRAVEGKSLVVREREVGWGVWGGRPWPSALLGIGRVVRAASARRCSVKRRCASRGRAAPGGVAQVGTAERCFGY